MPDTLFPLDRTEEENWHLDNVPLFDCPDAVLKGTYRFRWNTFRKHLKQTPVGYVVTEFLPDVPWAGEYNTISCPAGHHFYEGRWLRNRRYMEDYAQFWFRHGGEPRRYSFWAADAIYAYFLVSGNEELIQDLLPDLVRNYEAWEAQRQDPSGLFWQADDRDGMEFSLGGSGYRPTINSYMYGDAKAIARMAEKVGNSGIAEFYADKARALKNLVQTVLWDQKDKFFKVMVNDKGLAYTRRLPASWVNRLDSGLLQENRLADVCELQGYIPWYFGLPDAGYEKAWTKLRDPSGFDAPFGPATAEQRHPQFMLEHTHECLWNGPSWPFATTQTLVALANLLRDYDQDIVTSDDYFALLKRYASSQRRVSDGGVEVPWIDENLDPYTGEWIARKRLYERDDPLKDRGMDYNHSGFCDLIISGLIGLRPRQDRIVEIDPLLPKGIWNYFCLENVPYRGSLITIRYDKNGTRYGQGKGFQVVIDGAIKTQTEEVQKLCISLDE